MLPTARLQPLIWSKVQVQKCKCKRKSASAKVQCRLLATVLALHTGMGEFSSGELQKGSSRQQDQEEEEDQMQLELQPLWQHQLASDSQGRPQHCIVGVALRLLSCILASIQ